jgi:hypothetical protein
MACVFLLFHNLVVGVSVLVPITTLAIGVIIFSEYKFFLQVFFL